jgi:glycosyltransferase involved in cell wall biosynthesis
VTVSTVAVVVPTRNRVDVLAFSVHAVLAQQGLDMELIVVDEGSSDGTRAYLASLGDRVTVVRHDEPRGAAGARNAGISVAGAEYVAFCDDDDLWAPTKLAAQLEALAATDARWCATGSVMVNNAFRIIDHERPPDGGEVLASVLRRNCIPGGGSGVLAETSLIREAGGFWEDLRNAEDWELWIRVAERSPIAVVDAPLVAYRIWPGSKSRDAHRMDVAYSTIRGRYRAMAVRLGVVQDYVAHDRHLAKQHLRNGERLAAARLFLGLAQRGRRIHAVRAGVALVAPMTMDRVGSRRAERAVPIPWRAVADAWLTALVDEGHRAGIPVSL